MDLHMFVGVWNPGRRCMPMFQLKVAIGNAISVLRCSGLRSKEERPAHRRGSESEAGRSV